VEWQSLLLSDIYSKSYCMSLHNHLQTSKNVMQHYRVYYPMWKKKRQHLWQEKFKGKQTENWLGLDVRDHSGGGLVRWYLNSFRL